VLPRGKNSLSEQMTSAYNTCLVKREQIPNGRGACLLEKYH
jgi:hypothetical protein